MAAVDEAWTRVAEAVRSRRNALGLTQEEAATRSGGMISSSNWRVIEKGDRDHYRRASLIGVCRALEWSDESIDLILNGDEPQLSQHVYPGSVRSSMAGLKPNASPPDLRDLMDPMPRLMSRVEGLERAVNGIIDRLDEIVPAERAPFRVVAFDPTGKVVIPDLTDEQLAQIEAEVDKAMPDE